MLNIKLNISINEVSFVLFFSRINKMKLVKNSLFNLKRISMEGLWPYKWIRCNSRRKTRCSVLQQSYCCNIIIMLLYYYSEFSHSENINDPTQSPETRRGQYFLRYSVYTRRPLYWVHMFICSFTNI